MNQRRIVLVRHGRTAWNAINRFQGHQDVPLDDVGLEQAEHAARLLAGFPPSRIVASDLSRARLTAEPLARITGLPVHTDARLRETHGGVWEGRLDTEILADDGEAFAAWRAGSDLAAGGAETRSQVADRMEAGLTEALTEVPTGGVLVAVTHGGAARAVLGRFLGLPLAAWGALGGLANCNWSVLEETPASPFGWRLTEHNAGSLPEPVIGDDR
jgi:broad specificity phosphatase PhoE